MIYTIYPFKDATIYEKTESLNTGLDSILELSHENVTNSTSTYNSRILMYFNLSDLEEKLNSSVIPSDASYYLSLKTTDVKEVPQEYTIYAYPVSSSWINGTGQYASRPNVTDGVSWKYRTSKSVGTEWQPTQSLNPNVTGSYNTKVGGGTWWTYNNLVCSESFYYENSDVYMDITPMVDSWLNKTIDNDGLILKFDSTVETLPSYFSSIKFFGIESNTIYVPRLQVIWDDSQFDTGSLSEIEDENINLNVKLKKYYSKEEKAKIRIYGNKKYPQKTYTTQSYQLINYYLPETSYYEIRDAHSDEIILPFSNIGTKISCDDKGSYFNLWMNMFQPERFYRILIKVEKENGNNVQIFDNNFYFKVTR
jgi:hypothetical protein